MLNTQLGTLGIQSGHPPQSRLIEDLRPCFEIPEYVDISVSEPIMPCAICGSPSVCFQIVFYGPQNGCQNKQDSTAK